MKTTRALLSASIAAIALASSDFAATAGSPLTPNLPPIAFPQSVSVEEDKLLLINLTGADPNGNPLSYEFSSSPQHGALIHAVGSPRVFYGGSANYFGPDSFTFRVFDGLAYSAPATISINVLPVNDPPTSNGQIVNLNEDTATEITLTASDVDGDALTFVVTTPPTNGTLTGIAPNLVYHPATNYFGRDTFFFTTNDGRTNSQPARISLRVASINDAPYATFAVSPLTPFPEVTNRIVLGPVCDVATVVLDATASHDPDNDPLQFFWREGTNHFANGVMVTNQFEPGTHEITLVLSDGTSVSETSQTIEVLTPAQSVGLILGLFEDETMKNKQPLIASLNAAMRAFQRCNTVAALNELKAFQNKVNAQVRRENPELAAKLVLAAQSIIDAYGSQNENRKLSLR